MWQPALVKLTFKQYPDGPKSEPRPHWMEMVKNIRKVLFISFSSNFAVTVIIGIEVDLVLFSIKKSLYLY